MYFVGALEGRGRFSGWKIVIGNSSGESKFVPVGTGKSYLEPCFGALEIEVCFRKSTKTVIE